MSKVEYIPPGRFKPSLELSPEAHRAIALNAEQSLSAEMEKLRALVEHGSCEEAADAAIMASIHIGTWGSHTAGIGRDLMTISRQVDQKAMKVSELLRRCAIRQEGVSGFGGEVRKILGLPWWAVVGGGIVLLAGIGKSTQIAVTTIGKKLTIKRGREKFGDLIDTAARQAGIPSEVLTTFIALESSFKPDEYNPEPTALDRWPCQIAGDSKWKTNPDYANAAEVCARMKRDPNPKGGLSATAKDIAAKSKASVSYEQKTWKFGSFGLGQVSAIAARTAGFSYSRSNKELFKPEVNLALAAKLIRILKDKVYPGRGALTVEEWSRVRAAYVGGPGILTRGPTVAAQIAEKYREKAKEVTA